MINSPSSRLNFIFLVVLIVATACNRPTDLLRAKLSSSSSQQFQTIAEDPARNRSGNREKRNELLNIPPPNFFPPIGPPLPTDDDDGFFDIPFIGANIPLSGALGICGDGEREFFEECDLGEEVNMTNIAGCNNACQIPFCPNGVREQGEQCDDGNDENGDGCSDVCTFERCGNIQIDLLMDGFLEECDDGNFCAGDGCSPWCTIERCGNCVVDFGEECDDGNNKDGDGCNFCCKFEPPCPERAVILPTCPEESTSPTISTESDEPEALELP